MNSAEYNGIWAAAAKIPLLAALAAALLPRTGDAQVFGDWPPTNRSIGEYRAPRSNVPLGSALTTVTGDVTNGLSAGAAVLPVSKVRQIDERGLPEHFVLAAVRAYAESNSENAFWVGTLMAPAGGLALQADGKLVVAGGCQFFFIDTQTGTLGQLTSRAFRFFADGSWDPGFVCRTEPAHVGYPMSERVMVHPDGRLLLVSGFSSIDGKPRPGCAMLLPDGRLDDSFEPWRGMTNPPGRTSLASGISLATLSSNGVVTMLGADFDGSSRTTMYQLDSAGRVLPTGLLPNQSGPFLSPGLGFGSIAFDVRPDINWALDTPAAAPWPANMAGRPAGMFWPPFGPAPSAADLAEVLRSVFRQVPLESCRYAVGLPDGGFVLPIREEKAGSHLVRFDKNWRADLSFTNRFNSDGRSPLTLKAQRDGKILVAGILGELNGEPFPGLVRLEKTGAIDPGFHCQTEPLWEGRIMDMAIQDDGRIVICGFFSSVNGVACPHLARLNPDGSVDKAFQSHFATFQGLNAWRRLPVQSLAKAGVGTSTTVAGAPPPAAASAPETVIITSFRCEGGIAFIGFTGLPNRGYILQARDALNQGEWGSVSTNQTTAGGVGAFKDTAAGQLPMRFYRIASE